MIRLEDTTIDNFTNEQKVTLISSNWRQLDAIVMSKSIEGRYYKVTLKFTDIDDD